MSGRLEREPTEVGQAYVICSLCVSYTHHQAQSKKKKDLVSCLRTVVISQLWCLVQQPTESLAFRSHCFYQHVCAESALEIIYGFKNTDIVHSFCVILLNLFSGFFTHPEALIWRQSVLLRGFLCLGVCWMEHEVVAGLEPIPLYEFIHGAVVPLFIICWQWEAQTPGQ